MHRSAIIIFHKYLQLDTVANYGIESLITNGSIRRGVYTHDRGHIARTPRDCIWTLSMADRSASREPWMGQPSRFILPPPPHLIYSRASVSPSTHPPSNFDVDACTCPARLLGNLELCRVAEAWLSRSRPCRPRDHASGNCAVIISTVKGWRGW